MQPSKKHTILAGIFGNALEWYDFTVYAFFAPILANLFFPSKNPFISLLLTFGVFAVGFFARPVGGVIFGYMGDHFGRRKTLIVSITTMSIATLLLAVLPTYLKIGIIAPILLTVLRLIQGTAVSGELATAISYLIEHADAKRRGFAGSLAMCSAFLGILLSSAVAVFFTNILNDAQLAAWGWRLAFAIGGIAGIIGLKIRLAASETSLYEKLKKENHVVRTTIIQHFSILNWRAIFLAVLLTSVMAIGNYYLIAYFNTFLIKILALSEKGVMTLNFISLLLFTSLLPVMGILSDKIGRKVLLGIGIIGLLLFTPPIFWLLTQKTLTTALLAQIIFAIILAPITALIPTTLAEMFKTATRNASLAVGYNLSLALFGGTAPLVAFALVDVTKNYYAPAWYLALFAASALLTLLKIPESFQKELS